MSSIRAAGSVTRWLPGLGSGPIVSSKSPSRADVESVSAHFGEHAGLVEMHVALDE